MGRGISPRSSPRASCCCSASRPRAARATFTLSGPVRVSGDLLAFDHDISFFGMGFSLFFPYGPGAFFSIGPRIDGWDCFLPYAEPQRSQRFGCSSSLQVEETKVESLKRDKAATEKLLQETIERNQTELAAQKEFYANALNAAKEAEALAESRANNETKIELESRLREDGEKKAMLVQTLEELSHMLTRKEQEAAFREEMLKRDFDDLQKRYQASELRYNELITQVPESTRPLLRQIEAMQDTAARRAEAWAGVERALNSRLQCRLFKDGGGDSRGWQ